MEMYIFVCVLAHTCVCINMFTYVYTRTSIWVSITPIHRAKYIGITNTSATKFRVIFFTSFGFAGAASDIYHFK